MIRSLHAFWLLTILAAGPRAEEVWELVGKGYEDHAGLPGLRRRLEEAARTSRLELEARYGLRAGTRPLRHRLDVSRAAPSSLPGRVEGSDASFALGHTAFKGEAVVVTVMARRFLRDHGAAAVVTAHETAHAVLASALGSKARYEAVPAWFREGLAVSFAGEGEALVAEAMVHELLGKRRAQGFLVGLPAAAAPAGDVPALARVTLAESWLAVRELEARLGGGGTRRVVELLLQGDTLERAIEEGTGLTYDGFRAIAAGAAKSGLARLLPRETEEAFALLLEARERGDTKQVMERCGALLARAPAGPLAGTLGYFLARAEIEAAGPTAPVPVAQARLEGLLRQPAGAWRAEALVLLGECRLRAGQPAAARQCFEEVLEAYGEDRGPAARARVGLERAVVQ